MELLIRRGEQSSRVDVVREDGTLRITREGRSPVHVTVVDQDATSLLLDIDGRRHRVRWARRGDDLFLAIGGHAARFGRVDEDRFDEVDAGAGSPVVRTPMPGRVIEVLVAAGDEVRAGQSVARVEAMKMEVALTSAVDGVVVTVHVRAEQLVQPDEPLVTITPHASS